MVSRNYVNCLICGQAHTLRIGLGHNEVQEHTFPCRNCGEPITVRMHLDFENHSWELEYVRNCAKGDAEGLVVNLHPELLVPAGEEHDDFSFPWLQEMMRIVHDSTEKNPQMLAGKFVDVVAATGASSKAGRIHTEWNAIQNAWSLHNRGKEVLATEVMEKYFASQPRVPNSVEDWVLEFSITVVGGIAGKQFGRLTKALRDAARRRSEYEAYCQFVHEEHLQHRSDYYQIFQSFFEDYSEYSQVLLYVFSGLDIPEDFHATSHAFRRTKMFYGNAFEVLTSRVIVLATLSNILKGRTHDQFASLTNVEAYRKLKKESKCGPFSDLGDLSWICDDLDTTLRNASHHAAIHYDENDATITYRSGGTGAERRMTYSQYLLKCFDIFRRLTVLLRYEIVVSQIANQHKQR
jgi:hypothetical protein